MKILMDKIIRLAILASCCPSLLLTSCVETSGLSSTISTPGSNSTSATSPAPAPEALTKHDVALRFLTAFIRLDKNMALQYATPEAVSKLNWNMSHSGNIPYYDDKMILKFNGGWARVFFQDAGGTFLISDFEVYRR